MSLKIPGVGNKIEEYQYCVAKDNENAVCVIIKYDKSGNLAQRVQKAFEIRPDTRWPDPDIIVEILKYLLDQGLIRKNVKIREDKARMYIWFDDNQFTGNSI
ncbi:MAG: hypothetical protein K6F00_07025 [Lachnospiraceae bacterium]|nr:hypothetical protein [Lachnospiraceae bacterium]